MDSLNVNTEKYVRVNLFILITSTGIGLFMGALDSSIVNVSLFKIEEYFNVSEDTVQWVVLAYLIAMTALMSIAGALGDKISIKGVFQVGMLIFSIGSLLCSFATNIFYLIIARIIQSIGATGITANGIAILTRFTSREERGTAIGWNTLIVSLAISLGPILGGVLTQYFSWQSIFYINVPIGIIGFFYVQFFIPPTPPVGGISRTLDIKGSILFSSLLILFLTALTILGLTLTSTLIIILILMFFCSFVLLILFLRHSLQSSNPIVDFHLFTKSRFFSLNILSAFLTFIIFNSILFQLPFYLQEILNLSPSNTGVLLLGIPIMLAIAGPLAGKLSNTISIRYLTAFGLFGTSIGIVVLYIGVSYSNIFIIAGSLFILGWFVGFFSAPNGNAVMSAAPPEKIGEVGGLLGLARTIGVSFAISASTTLLALFQFVFVSINGGMLLDTQNYMPAFQILILLALVLALINTFVSYSVGNAEQIILLSNKDIDKELLAKSREMFI